MSYAIIEVGAAEWADELAGRPDAHLLQSSQWGEFKGRFGWRPQRLALRGPGGFVAGAQILWRSQWGLKIAYVPRGPLWAEDERANELLLAALERIARRQRAVFLRLEPNQLDDGGFDRRHSALLLAGYEPAAPLQPAASIHLDLAPAPEALLAGFSKGHRADIRRAERNGVTVRAGETDEDLGTFYSIMEATSARAQFAIHSRDYYAQAWELFGGRKPGDHASAARLLLAELAGETVAAFLVFGFGSEAQYMYSGATDAGLKSGANHALQWAALRWARERGCARYDFWGVPAAFADLEAAADDAERARLEEAAQASGMAGVYRFKKGFGGAVVRYAPAYDLVFFRPAYWLWQRRRGEG
ncbi:MAG TPA: peptidoglycan bridge formation glycyltransferase FemA/FemB family protein [Herpetosiphonaceae bacterium]